jgi:putative transposase
MEIKTPLQFGQYYHIYNRGNNGADLFFENENYYHFLRLYAKYIEPIAETYAWCLMKNHFHILVRIKEKNEILVNDLTYNTTEKPKVIEPYRQFSHLFNAYTQAINKRYHRTGSLFENKYERKLVASEKYFKQLIYYIHNNPVHHGFVKHMSLYPWSSYDTVLSNQPTLLKRKEVIEVYGSKNNFTSYHNEQHNYNEIKDYLIDF